MSLLDPDAKKYAWRTWVVWTKLFLCWCTVALSAFAGSMFASPIMNNWGFGFVATIAGTLILFIAIET